MTTLDNSHLWSEPPMFDPSCEVGCCNCGNDIGPHHLCTDCLEEMSLGLVREVQEGADGDR